MKTDDELYEDEIQCKTAMYFFAYSPETTQADMDYVIVEHARVRNLRIASERLSKLYIDTLFPSLGHLV